LRLGSIIQTKLSPKESSVPRHLRNSQLSKSDTRKDLPITQNRSLNPITTKQKLIPISHEKSRFPWLSRTYAVNLAILPLFRLLTKDHILISDQWKINIDMIGPSHFTLAD
jgi:hypothetical protein